MADSPDNARMGAVRAYLEMGHIATKNAISALLSELPDVTIQVQDNSAADAELPPGTYEVAIHTEGRTCVLLATAQPTTPAALAGTAKAVWQSEQCDAPRTEWQTITRTVIRPATTLSPLPAAKV